MGRQWRFAALAIALLGGVLLWRSATGPSASTAPAAIPAPSIVAARVGARQLDEHLEALGTTSSWESIELRPTVQEFVSEIHFHDGQVVAKGDLLVTLVRQEELAKLGEARAYLEEQQREVRRIESLVATRALPRNQLDERRTLAEIATQRVAAAAAAVADREIRAPFAGVLGLRSVSPGALVTPQDVVTTLDDIAHLRLDFPVPALRISELEVDSEVRASTPALAEHEFRGRVIGIDSRVNPVDRSVVVRARLDNEQLLLKPGMLLNVDLQRGSREALVVPEEALVHYQREHFVLRVDPADGNRLERRRVEIGLREPGLAEIRSGLAAGDLIVVEGLAAARDGQTVEIREIREPEAMP